MAPRGRDDLPVVLVHGFGISSSYFVPLAERLASRFDVYAPDLPGHGKSSTPPQPLDVRALAAALSAWLAAAHIERAHVVANSMGCQIAAELAAGDPKLVSRTVLIGPTLDREARSFLRVLPRFMAGGRHERFSMTALLVRDYSRMHRRLIAEFRAMLAHKIEDVLPRVPAPVLFIRGEHDAIAPQRWVEELVSVTPVSRMATVKGGGHAVHYGRADETLKAVVPFLGEDDDRGDPSRPTGSSTATETA
jgi:2-hydroxy-6-oxonona-2,4-dienedioate hydrolase